MRWESPNQQREVPSINALLKRHDELVPPTESYLLADETGNLVPVNSAEQKAQQPGAIAKELIHDAASLAVAVWNRVRTPTQDSGPSRW